jgi:hypothetical protein
MLPLLAPPLATGLPGSPELAPLAAGAPDVPGSPSAPLEPDELTPDDALLEHPAANENSAVMPTSFPEKLRTKRMAFSPRIRFGCDALARPRPECTPKRVAPAPRPVRIATRTAFVSGAHAPKSHRVEELIAL